MRHRLPISLLIMGLLAASAWGQTTASQPATQPATQPAPWVRVTTTTNQVGATALQTIQMSNTLTGVTLTQYDAGDNFRLQYKDPKERAFWDYTAAGKELRRGDLAPWEADYLPAAARNLLTTSLTYETYVAPWKQHMGVAWKDLPSADDGPSKRYDLDAAALQVPPRLSWSIPAKASIWVDPASKRLQKVTAHFVAGPQREWDVNIAYEYNVEGPEDLYAAGVPRDARIVDNRPDKDTRDVLDRVERRYNKGFGDCVGIQTDSILNPNGTPDPLRTTLRFSARKGNRSLIETFAVHPRSGAGRPGISLPEKWPNVDFDTLFALVRESTPHSFIHVEGDKVLSARFLRNRFDPSAAPPVDRWTAMAQANISTVVWPNPGNFGRWGPENHTRLIADEQHPGEVGIEVSYFGPSNDFYRSQAVYWIDPGKDDLMTESTLTEFRGGSILNRASINETKVLEVGRTQDGRHFPAHWTVAAKRPNPDGFFDPYMIRECRLFVAVDKGFDPAWVPSTQPASQPATAPATAPKR